VELERRLVARAHVDLAEQDRRDVGEADTQVVVELPADPAPSLRGSTAIRSRYAKSS
jgi:hypothetical protein